VYEPAEVGEGVFIGPGAVLTNDTYPRAITTDGREKSSSDWVPVGVTVGKGASIGAHATCVAPLEIGQWAVVAAGAVVTRDVPPYALVQKLRKQGKKLTCPVTGDVFHEVDGQLISGDDDV